VTYQEQLQAETLPMRTRGLPGGSASIHLDALRGTAAFGVLLTHWRDAFFVDSPPIRQHNFFAAAAYALAELGHQWVIVFFVMSGFLVGGSVVRAVESGRWNWRDYLLRRMTRLYIVLLPALLLGGLLDWAGMHIPGAEALYSGHSGMYSLTFNVHARLTLPVFAGNGLFLQGIVLPGGGGKLPTFGSNGPLWSLSNEFWYYLAFPLLTFLLVKNKSRFLRLACAVGLMTWAWFVGAEIVLLGIPWLMGVGIHYLPAAPVCRLWARRLTLAAALMLLGGTLVWGRFSAATGLTDMLVGVMAAFFVWVTLHYATGPLPRGYAKVAVRSARSSYTLYLVHLPLLVFFKAALHLPRAVPGCDSCLVALGLLAVTLVYGQLIYELFEKNTDALRKWIAPFVTGEAGARRLATE
jgi:peptidoglycan/LPS O-acetylase OafA/YrhL